MVYSKFKTYFKKNYCLFIWVALKIYRTKVVAFFYNILKRILQSIFRYTWPRSKFRGWRNVGFSKFFIKGVSALSVSFLCDKFKLKWWKTVQYSESNTKRYNSDKGECLVYVIDISSIIYKVFFYYGSTIFLKWQSNLLFYLNRIYNKRFCAISQWKN